MSNALTPAQEYVQEHRDDLMYLLRNGDETVRALALAVLLQGGQDADVQLVKRELELYQEADLEWN